MEFDNSITVQAPMEKVWSVMTDVHEVAPCVPGAQITEQIDEQKYKGQLSLKLGPMSFKFGGEVEVDPNEADHTITLRAQGRELSARGGTSGTVTARLSEAEGGTRIDIHSKVNVTGVVAQFSRTGIVQGVASRQLDQFASCLQQKLSS